MKYCHCEGDKLYPNDGDEVIQVALKLAYGAEYGEFDIDPFEAAFLIITVQDYASETNNKPLLRSCNHAMAKLQPHIDAFAVVVDHNAGSSG